MEELQKSIAHVGEASETLMVEAKYRQEPTTKYFAAASVAKGGSTHSEMLNINADHSSFPLVSELCRT